MTNDWFRSNEWTGPARVDFEARLARARPTGRAQYLRIKALALMDAGEHDAAEALFQRVIDDYPDNWVEVAGVQEQLGNSRRAVGDLAQAERHYRAALDASPTLSGTMGEVHLSLAEVVLLVDPTRVTEVDALLDLARGHVKLNSTAFRWNALKARAASLKGDVGSARSFAASALALMDAEPQFSRHPTVGVVRPSPDLVAELEVMASA